MHDQPKRKTTEIPPTIHRQFKKACADRGLPMNAAMEQAIRQWLKTKPAKKEPLPA